MEAMINEMLMVLASNQTIMKYVVYDDVTIDPLTLADVTDAYKYIYSGQTSDLNDIKSFKLFPTPFSPNVSEDKKTFILCYIKPKRTMSDRPTEKEFSICFDVFTHKDIWTIVGGKLRVFRICEEINNIWNKRLSDNSINKIFPISEDYIFINNNLYCGYHLEYMGTWFNKFADQVGLENG